MSQVDHMEVAPRMWDKTLAATYIPKEQHVSEQSDNAEPYTPSPTQVVALSMMDKLKMYMVPALLVLGIIISMYVLWKYFTIYKNNKNVDKTNPPVICEEEIKPNIIDPQYLAKTEDLSKYEFDSGEESSDEEVEVEDVKTKNVYLPKIAELSDEEESSDEEETRSSCDEAAEQDSEYEEGSDDSEEDMEEEDAPDISEIEQLINDTKFSDGNDIAILEDDDMFDIPMSDPPKKSKRSSKKTSRITL